MAFNKLLRVLTIASLAFFAQPANAQELVATHGDWSVFKIEHGSGSRTCYIASAPTKKDGNYSKRSDPYILVTSRDANTDEVSISSGYPFKKDDKLKVEVDANKHEFFTKDELAWAYDAAQDAKVVQQMKKGNRMNVRGTSQIGTFSVDGYSLKGITAAYNQMKALCN